MAVAVAVACARLGCEVTVFERHRGELRDRASGIGIPRTLRDELVERGYLPHGYRCWPDDSVPDDLRSSSSRNWTIVDGSHGGRVVWSQPGLGAAVTNNGSVRWSALRAAAGSCDWDDGSAALRSSRHSRGARCHRMTLPPGRTTH